jgi:hypothetical protein
MGSVPFKSREEPRNKLIEKLNNKHRQAIYEKWKYEIEKNEIIQCNITFDNYDGINTPAGFDNNIIETKMTLK